jgi:uncharacterized protein
MRPLALLLAITALVGFGAHVQAAEPGKNKRLLLVTHCGNFVHPSVATAEQVLKEIGPKNGFDVTCWRFIGDPDAKVKTKGGKEITALEAYNEKFRGPTKLPVEKEHCGRINKETLKNFDVVLLFTQGSDALTKEELADLREWVKNGGALAGTHCASDTLLQQIDYGNLIGAQFKIHPPGLQKIKVKVEDAKHPAAAGFTDGMDYEDEMYIFKDGVYSRERLHIILSIDPATFKIDPKIARADGDYAIAWCREEGKGKVFYTAFGHEPKVWKDEKFQKHLFGGIKWALGELPGDATPSAPKK